MGRQLNPRIAEELRRQRDPDVRLLTVRAEEVSLPSAHPPALARQPLAFWQVVLACFVANILYAGICTLLMFAAWGWVFSLMRRAIQPSLPALSP